MATKRPASSAAANEPPTKKSKTGGDDSLTTLHVSGLGSLTSAGLSDLFSAVGPIKSAFVVTEPSGASRGFGFVRFALAEDAQTAIARFSGHSVDGGTITATWARRRQRDGPEGAVPAADEKSKPPPRPAMKRSADQPKRPAAVVTRDDRRAVIVYGLSPTGSTDAIKKALYKKAKKLLATASMSEDSGDLIVEFPVELEGQTVALVYAPTPRSASQLSQRLHDHVFKGRLLTASLKWEHDAVTRKGRARGGGRLILRNLAWTFTADDARAVFAPHGPIHSIQIPTDDAGKPKGFAFVWMMREADAERAIKAVNGTSIAPGVAAQRALESSDERTKSARRKDKVAGKVAPGRVVAVDWALSREEFKALSAPAADSSVGATNEEVEEGDAGGAENDEDSDLSGEEMSDDDELSPVEIDEDDMMDDVSGEDEDASARGASASTSSTGVTLFVRNVQFEATENELFKLFSAFGPVRYARLVKDPATGRSRGTAFVCFYRDEDAQAVIAASAALEPTGAMPTTNPFAQPSVLSADPTSGGAARLTLHGRVLGVAPAVTRDEADKLRLDRDRNSKPKDRRNLYLLNEGVITPASSQAAQLDRTDLEARQSSFEARKSLLRSNPALFVSRTRLSIRQLPLHVDEKALKQAALHGIRAFAKEVKAGMREPLTAEERADDIPDPVIAKDEPAASKRAKLRATAKVKQAKILRQADRVDPSSGLGRSRGCGFLELRSHADALRIARWLNASDQAATYLSGGVSYTKRPGLNATTDGGAEVDRSKRRPIVEFAIENATTVARRSQLQERARNRPRAAPSKQAAVRPEASPSTKPAFDVSAAQMSRNRRKKSRRGP